jgi:hypothetical protein
MPHFRAIPRRVRFIAAGAAVFLSAAVATFACRGPSLDGLTFACSSDGDCQQGLRCVKAASQAEGTCQVPVDAALYGDGGCAIFPDADLEFLNRCTPSTCAQFSNQERIQGFDPANPRPPLPAPVDAGTSGGGGSSDAGVDSLPACSTLSPQPVIHVTGANAFKNVLGQLAIALLSAPNDADRRTIIFTAAGACQGVEALYEDKRSVRDFYKLAVAEYWSAGGDPTTTTKCRLDDATQFADLGLSGVYAASCNSAYALSATAGDFVGPVQTTAFVVPAGSSEHAISADAAYHVYALGDTNVAPWTERDLVFARDRTATVQQIIGKSLGVKPELLRGVNLPRSEEMVSRVGNSPNADATIGMLDSSFAESSLNAAKLRMIAYRAPDQDCGRFPNSTELSNDKRNVREGSYPLWSSMHFFAKVGTDKQPLNANVAQLLAYLSFKLPVPTVKFLDVVIGERLVPQCAMQVSRTEDMGPMSSYSPPDPCGCYMDSRTVGTTCQVCKASSECPAASPRCSFGYCER